MTMSNSARHATVTDVSFTGVATQFLVKVASGTTWMVYEQNLDVLRARDSDHPCQRQIEAARPHSPDAVAHAGAQSAGRGLSERRGVQKPHAAVGGIDRLVGIRVVEHLPWRAHHPP